MKRFMEDPQFQPFRVVILAVIAIVFGWSVITPAKAQARNKVVPVEKPVLVMNMAVCKELPDAVAILKARAEGKSNDLVQSLIKEAKCGVAQQDIITYHKVVYDDGEWRVIYFTDSAGQPWYEMTNWELAPLEGAI